MMAISKSDNSYVYENSTFCYNDHMENVFAGLRFGSTTTGLSELVPVNIVFFI